MIKRKYILTAVAACLMLAGCYDDRNGHDYDTVMPDVEMTIPETAYSAGIGSVISITPDVKTSIPETDLQYKWEVRGEMFNEHGREAFLPLVSAEEQGKELRYTCHLDTNITALNKSYTCRLHAKQLSTGRNFYSTNTFTITIAGITGLLVLHGDDASSDIGILEAEEFTPSANSLPASPSAVTDMYSKTNGGRKLQGKGETVVQSISSNLYNDETKKRCCIYAKTVREVALLNKDDFSYYGDWNSLFYLSGDRQEHKGQPEGYIIADQDVFAFDGGIVFWMQQSNQYPFLFPTLGENDACADGNCFTYAPQFEEVATSGIQKLMYATTVNGQTRKGFLGITQTYSFNPKYVKLLDTKADNVKFNLGDMKADLVVMRTDNREHVRAVLKGEADHPTAAGQFFAVDLWPNAPAKGESAYVDVPQYFYALENTLTGFSDAIAFEFGESKNMCYYATRDAVYHYGLDGSEVSPFGQLGKTDGAVLDFGSEITLMKLLASPNVTTRNDKPVLLVATWASGKSALWALHLDIMTGKVLKAVKYDETNVDGWAFGRIADVNIKGL